MKSLSNKPWASFLGQFVMTVALACVASHAFAQTSSEMESLGSNKDVKQRASNLESRSRIGIVQGRTVKRDNRLELGANYGGNAYGDSYLLTQSMGAQVDYHINTTFSLGVRYTKAFNNLTPEGQQVYSQAQANPTNFNIPQIAYPDQTVMAVVNWYMMYGKINFFDARVVQFDIYSLAGYGQVQMDSSLNGQSTSSWENTWTAGGGIAFWLTQHISSRFELRYQSYANPSYSGSNNLNLIVANLGIGVLL